MASRLPRAANATLTRVCRTLMVVRFVVGVPFVLCEVFGVGIVDPNWSHSYTYVASVSLCEGSGAWTGLQVWRDPVDSSRVFDHDTDEHADIRGEGTA
jgi:hypothetical protein